jgi:hypothetical protein
MYKNGVRAYNCFRIKIYSKERIMKVAIINAHTIDKEKPYAGQNLKRLHMHIFAEKLPGQESNPFYTLGEKMQKQVRKQVGEMVAAKMGLAGEKMHWSWKAGCNCGCSPAFIMDSFTAQYDIFADFTIELEPGD